MAGENIKGILRDCLLNRKIMKKTQKKIDKKGLEIGSCGITITDSIVCACACRWERRSQK